MKAFQVSIGDKTFRGEGHYAPDAGAAGDALAEAMACMDRARKIDAMARKMASGIGGEARRAIREPGRMAMELAHDALQSAYAFGQGAERFEIA